MAGSVWGVAAAKHCSGWYMLAPTSDRCEGAGYHGNGRVRSALHACHKMNMYTAAVLGPLCGRLTVPALQDACHKRMECVVCTVLQRSVLCVLAVHCDRCSASRTPRRRHVFLITQHEDLSVCMKVCQHLAAHVWLTRMCTQVPHMLGCVLLS
jgi:hypothetical protein